MGFWMLELGLCCGSSAGSGWSAGETRRGSDPLYLVPCCLGEPEETLIRSQRSSRLECRVCPGRKLPRTRVERDEGGELVP